jgi:high-affinity nickel permease
LAFGTLTLLAGALGVGALHAFEVDHMTAVSAFVARRPRPAQAVWFGIKWAIGHGASLLLLGSVLYALKRVVPENLAGGMERLGRRRAARAGPVDAVFARAGGPRRRG